MEPSASNNQMTCPKCKTVQPQADTCQKCGIVIAKYHALQDAKQSNAPIKKASIPRRPQPKKEMTKTQMILAFIATFILIAVLFQFSQYQQRREMAKQNKIAAEQAAAKRAEEEKQKRQQANNSASQKQDDRSENTAQRGADCITKSGYFAATTENLFDQALALTNQQDTVALQKLYDAGTVFSMKAGIPVYLIKVTFTGKRQIRPEGYTDTLWTFAEALDCRR